MRNLKGLAGIATATAVGLGLAGCGDAAQPATVDDTTPTVIVEVGVEPSVTATPPPEETGNQGETGDNSGSGAGPQPVNEPPYIRDIYPDVYVTEDDSGRTVIAAIMQGHAYDPDGPDDQENTARIRIDWGDGNSTDASLEGHGAFRAWYDYPSSFGGRSMTVRIVAHGHDGQTATRTVTLDLPGGVQ